MESLLRTNVSNLSIEVLYDPRFRNSFCWKYFGYIVSHDNNKRKIMNPDYVYCSACLDAVKSDCEDVTLGLVKIKRYSKTVSTGNLTRHLGTDHHITDKPYPALLDGELNIVVKVEQDDVFVKETDGDDQIPSNTRFSGSTASAGSKHDKEQLAKDLVFLFCKSLLPFDSVAGEGMVDFFEKYKIIANEDDLPSRHSVGSSALTEVYESMLSDVIERISIEAPRYCAITLDTWTDQFRKLDYITFTLHYLTREFEQQSFTLRTQLVTRKEKFEKVYDMIKDIKENIRLDSKVMHVVCDAGTHIERVNTLDHHLCLGHALHNLVTVDGIDSVTEAKELVVKCMNIVKAFQYRLLDLESHVDENEKTFLNVIERLIEILETDEMNPVAQTSVIEKGTEGFLENIPPLSAENVAYNPCFKSTTPTRWYVLLEILESFVDIGNRNLIHNLLGKIGGDDLKIAKDEWILLEDLVKFLKRFREAVEIISSQKTCSINIALVLRSEIIDILKSFTDDESHIVCSVKRNMLTNINKRFPVTRTIIAAALLDVRFMGLKEVASYLKSQNKTKVSFFVSYIKEIVGINDLPENSKTNATSSTVSESASKSASILSKLSKKHSTSQIIQDDPVEKECWRYFASTFGPAELENDSILNYWNEKKKDFPCLSTFARAVLCVPVTSTPIDSVFSTDRMIHLAKRSRLSPREVNKVIFIHDNYKK